MTQNVFYSFYNELKTTRFVIRMSIEYCLHYKIPGHAINISFCYGWCRSHSEYILSKRIFSEGKINHETVITDSLPLNYPFATGLCDQVTLEYSDWSDTGL